MIPLYYFLLAWLVFLALFAVMSLLTMLQMVRFGIAGLGTYSSTFIFLMVTAGTVLACAAYFATVNWSEPVNLFGELAQSPFFNP